MAIDLRAIPGSVTRGLGGGERTGVANGSASGGSPATASPRGDRFDMTDSASHLRALELRIAALPEVDMGRVEEVQRALATGSFQIDPVSTAEGVLEMERAFA